MPSNDNIYQDLFQKSSINAKFIATMFTPGGVFDMSRIDAHTEATVTLLQLKFELNNEQSCSGNIKILPYVR